ncbi:MAG: hypothetical protein V2I51_06930 [Anderseniella sp.]|jgi:hypothetical protein|nr:hypothetical protein [Anderseniella sp.]
MPFSHEPGPVNIGEFRHDGKPEVGCPDCFQHTSLGDESKVPMRLPNRPGAVAALPEPSQFMTLRLHETGIILDPA